MQAAPEAAREATLNTSRRTVLQAGAGAALGGLPWRSAKAQAANTIRIALLCDFSGTYRDVTGPTELACVRQAVAEFSNRGFNVEVVFADNQNRPDVGSNLTRQWFDREGVDVVVDGGASSVALAVNDIVREKNKVFLNSSSATSDLTGSKCTPNTVHWTYDTWMLAKSTGDQPPSSGPGRILVDRHRAGLS
jgi:branched-chain amino acid transport system substrate-binding protein